MSMKLAEILAPDGAVIYIQYDDEENDELRAVGVLDDIEERTKRFQALLASTLYGYSKTILEAIQTGMKELRSPEKATLEFGLQLGGESGIPFVTKGTAEANVKVTVEWSFKEEEKKK